MPTIKQAEGLAELGLWEEAWETLDELSALDRIMPPALRIRLDCCPHMNAWLEGMEIAKLLRDGTAENRLAAAHFYLELARLYIENEEWEGARRAVQDCVMALPEGHEELLKDPAIAKMME
ncbi:hypothetical protein OJ996_20540 [Luteolibacter sp. GHJ8]|uniref:Tetratricopeptide repeat protein n=2 Tax=Luteolibacter rhizosphaerae TaxID=2989719 RepID=A0ABT3G804_9BACT|nr:hypothetical protein [Luteolibacter rhizosphaerae]